MSHNIILKINDLKSGYIGMEVLHGLSFEVEEGKISAIIGPNGSGKSTLLRSIFNLADIFEGNIIFDNQDITKIKTYKLIKQGISFVPQGRQIFSNMTVRENLEMGGFIINNKSLINQKIKEIFEEFPQLRDRSNDNVSSLSGGQQQLLSLARALVQSPKLLLLDEPSLGLDPKAMKEIFNKIIEIKNSGVTVIIIEQNVKQVVEISDKIYVLESGNIALFGGKEVVNDQRIRDIYFGNDFSSKLKLLTSV